MAYPQEVLWFGPTYDDLGGSVFWGTLGSEYFVTGDTDGNIYLWQVGDPPGLRDRLALEYFIGEYGYEEWHVGVQRDQTTLLSVALSNNPSDTGKYLLKITADLDRPQKLHHEIMELTPAVSVPDIRDYFISGDGTELVITDNSTTIAGYSTVDGTLQWSHPLLWDTSTWDWYIYTSYRQSGYVAAVPKAGRYIFVNTSNLTLSDSYLLDWSSRFYTTWDLHFTATSSTPVRDYTAAGETITDTSIRFRLAYYPSSVPNPANMDALFIDGGSTEIVPSLSALAGGTGTYRYSVAQNSIAYPGTGTYTTSVLAEGTSFAHQWLVDVPSIYQGSLRVTVDNSDRGGGFIELRDDTGAILDSISFEDYLMGAYDGGVYDYPNGWSEGPNTPNTGWTVVDENTVAYARRADNGSAFVDGNVYVRGLSISGDTLSWVGPERAVPVAWDTLQGPIVTYQDGRLVVAPRQVFMSGG